MIAFRQATAMDAGAVMALLMHMHRECGLAGMDHGKVADRIDATIERGFVVLAHDGQNLVGSLGASTAEPFWYSDQRVVGDWWNYVHPRYRPGPVGIGMMLRLRRWARDLGLPLMIGRVGRQMTPRAATRAAARPGVAGVIYYFPGGA